MGDFYCDEVVSGRTRVRFRHQDSQVVAFDHTRPSYRDAHVIVIPRRHVADLLSVDTQLPTAILEVVRQQASVVLEKHGACRITNLGTYQESKHLHWHVVSGDRQ